MKTVNSISALKSQIMKQMQSAVTETVDESFKDMHANVDSFYNSPEGGYSRTVQLAESPQHDVNHSGGDTVTGGIRLDTGYRYDPSGRDIQTIYNYAEDGGLVGNGGFWAKMKEDFEHNMKMHLANGLSRRKIFMIKKELKKRKQRKEFGEFAILQMQEFWI